MDEGMTTSNPLHPVTGGCACGAVRYACDIESETALCSCDLCRRSSGSAFQAWVNGSRASLRASGELGTWASSGHAVRRFCCACGTSLFLFERDEPEVVEVAAGTIDAPDGITSARVSRAYAHKRPAWGRGERDGA
jgi:hypothetical protein